MIFLDVEFLPDIFFSKGMEEDSAIYIMARIFCVEGDSYKPTSENQLISNFNEHCKTMANGSMRIFPIA